jgi:hypothetical protein
MNELLVKHCTLCARIVPCTQYVSLNDWMDGWTAHGTAPQLPRPLATLASILSGCSSTPKAAKCRLQGPLQPCCFPPLSIKSPVTV